MSFLHTYRKTASLGAAVSANVLAFLRQKMRKIAMFLFSLISQAAS
jgi:hypothetical protein